MAKMSARQKDAPIAPDGNALNLWKPISNFTFIAFIPNSTIRSMFKLKESEPVEVKMFRLRLVCRFEWSVSLVIVWA
jgi:hypothetical protein